MSGSINALRGRGYVIDPSTLKLDPEQAPFEPAAGQTYYILVRNNTALEHVDGFPAFASWEEANNVARAQTSGLDVEDAGFWSVADRTMPDFSAST